METSSDEGSFSDPSDGEARGGRRGGDGSKGAWPRSYRQSIDMLSVVPSPTVSMLMAASPNLTRFGSSFLKAGSSFFLRKGDDSVLPLTRPMLPPSLSQLSQSSLRPQPPMRQSTDILAQPPRPPAGHEAQLPDRPSRACLRPDYIELPPPASKCSRNQSIINGFNMLCGVGILTTSYGIKEGGWSSLLLLPLLGGSSCYTGLLMKRCIDSLPNIGTYPDIGQAAFGVVGRIFVSVVLYLELYASCVEYITLLGDNMSSVFPSAHLAFTGIDLNAHTLFAITTALAILPIVCLRNLSLLSYLSAGGVMATIAVIVFLFWVGSCSASRW